MQGAMVVFEEWRSWREELKSEIRGPKAEGGPKDVMDLARFWKGRGKGRHQTTDSDFGPRISFGFRPSGFGFKNHIVVKFL
jgi:hypothetical protein